MRLLYFFRNDLRLSDNPLLCQALQDANEVAFVYCPSKSHLRAGAFRQSFINDNVKALALELSGHHHVLGFADSTPEAFAKKFLTEFDAFALATEPTFEELQDLNDLKSVCDSHGKTLFTADNGSLLSWSNLPFKISKLPKVFTDFRKQIELDLQIPALAETPDLKSKTPPKKLMLPELKLTASKSLPFQGGASAGCQRLIHYLWDSHAIQNYKETRNGLLNFNDSSKLSPWLSLGSLSPRQIFWELKKYEELVVKNESTYWLLFELLWREYFRLYAQLHQEKVFQLAGPFGRQKEYEASNEDSLKKFEHWRKGETTSSFVNAGMKELAVTGFLSNRLRQNVASYLCKTMNLPWTWGADYFEEVLIDYDASSNWGNWNYVAGVGTDPRDRIFNPDRQAEMYDPEGVYQKKWLP